MWDNHSMEQEQKSLSHEDRLKLKQELPCHAEGYVNGKTTVNTIKLAETELESRLLACEEEAEDGSARWLSENFHLVRRSAAFAAEAFSHAKRLPAARSRQPRIWEIAEAAAVYFGGSLDAERLRAVLAEADGLCERELYLLEAALRGALLCCLVRERDKAEPVFRSLYALDEVDMAGLQEEFSPLERILRSDTAYCGMDAESRRDYRRRISALAEREHKRETQAAEELLQKAKAENVHFGSFLYRKHRSRGAYYLACILPAVLLSVLIGKSLLCALLLVLPLSEACQQLTERLFSRCVRPARLPRMDYSHGIPAESRTLAVYVVLLQNPKQAREAAERLEEARLANRNGGKSLLFGLLADLAECKTQSGEGDSVCIAAAKQEIERLNRSYGGGFFLFSRERSYSGRDKLWRGWERKRGAVLSLLRLLRGGSGTLACAAGDETELRDIRFLMVLDADTDLCPETVSELAGILAHPLQRPIVENGRIRKGYGVIQPKLSVRTEDAERSLFSRIASGGGGLDCYGSVNGEFYQDAFGEGSFSGKGLMDVDAACACLDGSFPENRLLSHDLIEGAYLGCAYAGDVELSEGFPSGFFPYYRRLHRWVRGDWQTIPWLWRRVRNERGERVKNPVGSLTKWKILNNLRRSLTPAVTLMLFFLYGFTGAKRWGIALAVSVLCHALRFLCSSFAAAGSGRRHRGGFPSVPVVELLQLLYLLLLLPYAAFVPLSAACTALYRMCVSHRRLLEWVPAADSGGAETLWRGYQKMALCPLAAVIAFFGTEPLLPAMGVCWIFAPLIAFALSRERNKTRHIRIEDRVFLQQSARDIWGYFDCLSAERAWLPPDNVSEFPKSEPAERTSPTNLGLTLLSAVAAVDLKLCGREKAVTLIAGLIGTMETLPRFRGHFYNWYDTRTGTVLEPAFISTVDSGNLLAALITLKAALAEFGETALAERVRRMADSMPLGFLYDAERKLFHIGWNPKKDAPSGGHYDMLESEARLTSYIAIARGEAERKHWRTLNRTLWHEKGRSGLCSWTGTMFEYFLPELFLPEYRGSLLSDSLKSCRSVQSACQYGGVWGKSESAYAETEADMSYRYRAHGVQTLALKRGMDKHRVIAPYASFISLRCGVHASVQNLLRLRAMGAEGRFGFYDAVDFSGGEPEIVRTFMVHHLGMSLLSIDNAICDDVMCKRFFADKEQRAYAALLKERSFTGEKIRKLPERTEEKPMEELQWRQNRTEYDLEAPCFALLSNGSYHVLLSELGASRSESEGCSLAAGSLRHFDEKQGILFFARSGETLLSLQPAPCYDALLRYSTGYDGMKYTRYAVGEGLAFQTEFCLPQYLRGEKRSVRIRNTGAEKKELQLVFYFEPALSAPEQFEAHPAFSRLCLQSRMERGCLTVSRRAGGTLPPKACAVRCSEPCRWETDRVSLFGRGGLRALPRAVGRAGKGVCDSDNPCVYGEIGITLMPGEEKQLDFFVSLAETREEAVNTLFAMQKNMGENRRFAQLTKRLRMSPAELERSFKLLTPLCGTARAAGRERSALWRWGISGDLPIAAAELPLAEAMLKSHALLSGMGYAFDLAVLVEDEGVYGRPDCERVRALAETLGTASLLGKKGGIHLVGGDTVAREAVKRFSSVCGYPAERKPRVVRMKEAWFLPKQAVTDAEPKYAFGEDAVHFSVEGVWLRPWCNLLTNARMGWIATDAGTGNLWLDNARESRITPWENDPLSLCGTEQLTLLHGGARHSLFADADGFGTEVEYGFGYAKWKRRIGTVETELCAFIPPEENGLVLRLTLQNAAPNDKIRFFARKSGDCPPGIELFASREPIRSAENELNFRTDGKMNGGERCFAAEFQAEHDLVLVLGEQAAAHYASERANSALERVKEEWRRKMRLFRVETPSAAMNHYLNGWAMYQVYACRLLGRSSVYQSGGAYGFRDQLQDACSLAVFLPELLLRQILLAAEHQYEEGDVMHWWHPLPTGDRGVRTRCSDDLLWLPYAACLYAEYSGDTAVWEKKLPFLHSPPLQPAEADRYETAEPGETGTLREHCRRAIAEVLRRGCGAHGLLRMGSGDWNDGFDRVGGESEWLTWFAALVLHRFGMEAEAKRLGAAADAAWADGQYVRGYYEDGTPLGAAGNAECELDSLAQSFAVLSGFGSPEKARAAVRAAAERLTDEEHRLIKLFTPPFDGVETPGYIRSYLPGVRENGGQYTHGAVWLAAACLRCGETELGYRLLQMLLPETHREAEYQAEPYVLAADVYSNPAMAGRAGWSWYTGAAGWYLRTVTEELLGVHRKDGKLQIRPKLPKDWERCRINVDGAEFELRNPENNGS